VLLAVALGACLAVPAASPAAPPANDDFAAASVIVGTTANLAGTTVGATTQGGEPTLTDDNDPAYPLTDTVWYAWTPATSGYAEFNTCAGNQVDVFTGGTLATATRVSKVYASGACSPFTTADAAEVKVAAGTTYHVRVGDPSISGPPVPVQYAPGPFTIHVNPAPLNDTLAGAFAISDSVVNDTSSGDTGSYGAWPGENIRAGTDPNEAQVAGTAGGHTAWYSWTAPSTTNYTFTTCGSLIDTLLGVYTGAAHPLTLVADDDDAAGVCAGEPTASAVQFSATQGTTYKIAVDGKGGAQGPFTLNLPPSNDALADLTDTIFDVVSATGEDTRLATDAPGEPAHAGVSGSHSVWFQHQFFSAGKYIVSTCGSSFDTTLDVYTSGGLSPTFANIGSPVASSDDFAGCSGTNPNASAVTFTVLSASTYRIAIDGHGDGAGQADVAVRRVGSNDAFASPAVFSAPASAPVPPQTALATNIGDSAEAGEPAHAGSTAAHSLWYSVTPGVTGPLTLNTCGSSYDTVLAVYTGSVVTALTAVPGASDDDTTVCGDGRAALVTFNAVAGTTYHAAVDGKAGATGFGKLNIQPIANDAFDAAVALPSSAPLDIAFDGNGASAQAGEPGVLGNPPGPTVWYAWTAPTSGTATLDACPPAGDGPFVTYAAAYTGSAVGALTSVTPDMTFDTCPDGVENGTHATFHAAAGATYRLQLQALGSIGLLGHVHLTLIPDPAAPGGGSPAPPGATPPATSATTLPTGHAFALLKVHGSIKDLRGKGLTVSVRCTRACHAAATITISASLASRLHIARAKVVTIAKAAGSRKTAGVLVLRVRATHKASAALRHARSLSATLTVAGADALGAGATRLAHRLGLHP
jgi:hypothetical protein